MTDVGFAPERKGTMVTKKFNQKIKAVFASGIMLMALLCGCDNGGQEEFILVGSGGAAASAENAAVNATENGGTLTEQEKQPAVIRVYVCGAVVSPGVVEIPEKSRVENALSAAQGFAENAAREAVNLADWVSDGQMLYFPAVGETEVFRESAQAQRLVNINTADVAQLCTLPGIGETRAADIIAYREKNGSFQSCEDIMKVSGIKTNVYEKICDKITVK